jgi:UDP-glucose:(heptosyl)LPS alpha-1,3-glucosyltransferase
MKIALNIEMVSSVRGGAEKYAGTVARWLHDAGHEVHIFARNVDPGELPSTTPVHLVRPLCPPGFRWLRSYLFARASERALRTQCFDLIIGFVKVWYQHVHLAVGGAHPAALAYSSRRFRSPWRRAGWWTCKALSPRQWIFRAIARKQYAGSHRPHVIAPARMVAEHFERYHNVSAQRIAIVYNALDAGAALPDPDGARAEFRRRHGLRPDDVAVLFVARNYGLKGLEPLLEAFAPVARDSPNSFLLVCGSRRDGRFRRQVLRLGLRDRVLFLGVVDDIRGCYAGSDVFAFPTFYDPCSLVVLEAMQAGLPVITTRQNGAGELLREGMDGFVVDSPWTVDQLTDRVARLVRDGDLRRHMGGNARMRVRAFTVEARQAEMLAALNRAASDPNAHPGLRDAA